MADFDARLAELSAQKAQLRSVKARLDALREQERALEAQVLSFEVQAEKEEEDVRRLEGRSLRRLYYTLTGVLGEKERAERAQAQEARVRCDAAQKALNAVREEIDRLGALAYALRDCEAQAQQLMQEKAEALRRAGTPDGARMLELEGRMGELTQMCQELDEAIDAGRQAQRTADAVIECFDDAKGFSVWDMLGGDLIADIAKHRALDGAQEQIEQLQIALRRFSAELADIELEDGFRANIDGFLHFADYFFDGLITDWLVMSRIDEGKRRTQETRSRIDRLLLRMEDMRRQAQNEQAQARRQLEQMIFDARV